MSTFARAVPRLALAVAEYRARFGEWPTHAHGDGVMAILQAADASQDEGREDSFQILSYEGAMWAAANEEYVQKHRRQIVGGLRSRLVCDEAGLFIEVGGVQGRCAYGLIDRDDPRTAEAYRWVYGVDPWWMPVDA